METPYAFQAGNTPLLVSFPHHGTELPEELAARMTPAALALPDTDWHVARLYDFVSELGASTLVARCSRYVVDLNRDPAGGVLYPGADNTEICPTRTFDRGPIYRRGAEPDATEIEARVQRWFWPYHRQLAEEIARLRAEHGRAVVLDAHSIRSRVPRFFDGTLPDLNLGTGGGTSCAPELSEQALSALASSDYSAVRDARFKGGWITRHYGCPEQGVHALQLELSQRNYMNEEPPYAFDEALAVRLRPVLRRFVETLLDFARRA